MGLLDNIKRKDEPYYTAYIIENKERIKVLHAAAGSKTFVWKQERFNISESSRTAPGDEIYTIDPRLYLYRFGLNTVFVYEHGNTSTPITPHVTDLPQKMPTPEDLYIIAEDTLAKNTVRGMEKIEGKDAGKMISIIMIGLFAVGIIYYFITM